MTFSTKKITEANAQFANIQQIGTATLLDRYTGEEIGAIRIFIAVMPTVPDDEAPTMSSAGWLQETYRAEVLRLYELKDAMRQNADVGENDSLWTAEKISEQAIQTVFDRIEDWQEAFDAGDNAQPEREALRMRDVVRC